MQKGIKGHHEGDWQYYLHRDVHGDYSFYGTPFLDVRCKTESDNLWKFLLWQEEKVIHHKKQQCVK